MWRAQASGAQAGISKEGFPPQLIKEFTQVVGAQITKEVAHGPAMLTWLADPLMQSESTADQRDQPVDVEGRRRSVSEEPRKGADLQRYCARILW
jgi:hypothetical protein